MSCQSSTAPHKPKGDIEVNDSHGHSLFMIVNGLLQHANNDCTLPSLEKVVIEVTKDGVVSQEKVEENSITL